MRRVKLTIERSGCYDPPPNTPGHVVVVPQVPKLPNFDLPLPPDVLAIMDTNREFHKKPLTNTAIIKRSVPGTPVASGSGSKIDISNIPPEENFVEFDPSEKPLKATPKRVGAA